MDKLKHVAIIMDGNGRWASKQKLERNVGHLSGSENVRNISIKASDLGLEVLTLYAFSTENWKRPLTEIEYLMKLFQKFFSEYLPELMANDIKVMTIGDVSRFPSVNQKIISEVIKKTENNKGLILNFALNYGSKHEIIAAVNKVAEMKLKDPKLVIDEELFESNLMTAGLPEVDLLIRTSGEERLSNFLLYQLAYSELMFVKEAWPEFTPDLFKECLDNYYKRQRRYGGL